MKKILTVLISIAILFGAVTPALAATKVKGYTKKNGTYVTQHSTRSTNTDKKVYKVKKSQVKKTSVKKTSVKKTPVKKTPTKKPATKASSTKNYKAKVAKKK